MERNDLIILGIEEKAILIEGGETLVTISALAGALGITYQALRKRSGCTFKTVKKRKYVVMNSGLSDEIQGLCSDRHQKEVDKGVKKESSLENQIVELRLTVARLEVAKEGQLELIKELREELETLRKALNQSQHLQQQQMLLLMPSSDEPLPSDEREKKKWFPWWRKRP